MRPLPLNRYIQQPINVAHLVRCVIIKLLRFEGIFVQKLINLCGTTPNTFAFGLRPTSTIRRYYFKNRWYCAANASALLGASDFDIVIGDDPDEAIPETGVGASTPTSNLIFMWIDPKNPNFRENIENQIRSSVCHELHHAVRNRFFPWRSETLLGAMVTEGLADHFDMEVNGTATPLWSRADQSVMKRLLRKAEPLFGEQTFDRSAWFFGTSDEIPRWAGYALGFQIVEDYQKRTGALASELVDQPAETFISPRQRSIRRTT